LDWFPLRHPSPRIGLGDCTGDTTTRHRFDPRIQDTTRHTNRRCVSIAFCIARTASAWVPELASVLAGIRCFAWERRNRLLSATWMAGSNISRVASDIR
jgi:hypothetical protein